MPSEPASLPCPPAAHISCPHHSFTLHTGSWICQDDKQDDFLEMTNDLLRGPQPFPAVRRTCRAQPSRPPHGVRGSPAPMCRILTLHLTLPGPHWVGSLPGQPAVSRPCLLGGALSMCPAW